MARSLVPARVDPGRLARGLAVVLLEIVFLAYVVAVVRGDWPPGHPWTLLGGGVVGVALLLGT